MALLDELTGISIHAPRTGSDNGVELEDDATKEFQSTLPARGATHVIQHSNAGNVYFNPRSPHGERQRDTLKQQLADAFQSTLPARGATRTVNN